MSSIYDIAGTSANSFSINGKCTLLQGDTVPSNYQGVNGDIYIQSNGSLYAKRNDTWLDLTGNALPNAASGKDKFITSNGSTYEFTSIDVSNLAQTNSDQTITGDNKYIGNVNLQNNAIDLTKNPSSTQYKFIDFLDKNNDRIGVVGARQQTDGYYGAYLQAGNQATISVVTNGTNVYTSAPTPSASNSTTSSQIATIAWVNDPTKSTNVVHRTGNETIEGTKTFSSDINGTAVRAKWADLAEYYESDNYYCEGTLVQFGGEKEITIATTEVNAIVSTKPGLVLNDGYENSLPLALCGRVPVLTVGKVNKFDYLVLSDKPGIAVTQKEYSDKVIGRALESNDFEGTKLVLCATLFHI